MASTHYLAVLKAAYDYDPQSEDEIPIKEDQLLYLLERTDDDWWKVKPRDAEENDKGGLVPAAYVEPAVPKSVVKVLYDYDATAPGELSVKEDEILRVFDQEDDWLLVSSESDEARVGFIPGNYVEDSEDNPGVSAPAPTPQIVVPPSPPRPVSVYVDPAERVAAASSKVQADSIETWSVSEVDKKGKKKKGTLGIGNGSIFFASESDKTPVQKWQTTDVESTSIDKSKHVHIDIGGATPINLHFHAGSKDVAEAIVAKLGKSKQVSTPLGTSTSPEPEEIDEQEEEDDHDSRKNGVTVHFSTGPPSIISPREPSEEGDAANYNYSQEETVTALYDFTADGDDELSVTEGEKLVVLEKDGDEWWKVRNSDGKEGVVPASYVELDEESASGSHTVTNGYHDAEAAEASAREEEEREAREAEEREREQQRRRLEEERRAAQRERERKAEADRKAKAAKEAAEAEKARMERESEKKKAKEEELRQRELENQRRQSRPTNSSESRTSGGSQSKGREDRKSSPSRGGGKSRGGADGKPRKGGPSPSRTRTWHDRTGQFKVDAEFLGYAGGKLRLHKVNGVVIEVPAEKMSAEDIKYVESMTKKSSTTLPVGKISSDDDEPLAVRRRSLQPEPKPAIKQQPAKKGPAIDWFEFFLNAGCDVDDCTRYASSFERDKIDESILPDITAQTMRSLGLREGDIIRVTKAISARQGGTTNEASREQLKKDEELARQLQEEENTGRPVPKKQSSSPAPNLFAGPGGTLKNNTRRGRPQPSKSTPPATVDLISLTSASEQLTRTGSPSIVSSPVSVQSPVRASSAAPTAPTVNGFDDDAWTNRPSSTKPLAPTPPANRAPSAPPAQTAPATAATQPVAPTPPVAPPAPPAPAVTETTAANSLAKTTESDVFNQLARLTALRTQSPAVVSSPSAVTASPPIASPPPTGFQQGLGMGTSPVPIGQFGQVLPTQPTGLPQLSVPRGPFAPVPANQGLLQPLVPTATGFNSFLPTRPASTPQFTQPQLQAPSFLSSQSSGYPAPLMSQPTGYQVQVPNQILSQQTGFPVNSGSPSPFAGITPLQPNPTGFNPMFNQIASPPPPVPPLPGTTPTNNSPANIFAQMKSGTFGNDSAPQGSNKYDALRPQPTGWGVQGNSGFQNGGYGGPFY